MLIMQLLLRKKREREVKKRNYKGFQKRKRLIQIRTAKNKWKTVELIKFLEGGRILIKLNRQLIKRKSENIRMGVVHRIQPPKTDGTRTKVTKRFKTRGKSRKLKKKSGNRFRKNKDNWKT